METHVFCGQSHFLGRRAYVAKSMRCAGTPYVFIFDLNNFITTGTPASHGGVFGRLRSIKRLKTTNPTLCAFEDPLIVILERTSPRAVNKPLNNVAACLVRTLQPEKTVFTADRLGDRLLIFFPRISGDRVQGSGQQQLCVQFAASSLAAFVQVCVGRC